MGRRKDRDAIQARWLVHEPRVPGTPFRKKDIDDAKTRFAASEPVVESSAERAAPQRPRDSATGSEGVAMDEDVPWSDGPES
jgi:hypothetical protein